MPIARKDIVKEVGIKTTAANRHLRLLVDSSRAKRLNDGTATKYKLAEPSSAMKEYYFIYMNKEHIGYLGFTNGYYLFAYSNVYLMDDLSEPISSTLPISEKIYRSEVLFPVIEAMLPEGIDKDILERKSGIPTEFYLFEYLDTDTADMVFSRTKLTYKRTAKIEDIDGMKDEDKIIERLRLFSGGVSEMLFAELGRRKLYKGMDVL